MKFWELTSAFRSEKENIISALKNPVWKIYKSYYDNLNDLINTQNREILDSEVPFDLAYEVSSLSKLKFWLYYKRIPHFLTSWQQGTDEAFEAISAEEILIRFGGSYIEETMERSVSEVMPKALHGKVEVIGAYNVTIIGMVAFLRVENEIDISNKQVCSSDGRRQWLVITKDIRMFVDPVSAYMKIKSQEEQGIYQYIIKPLIGSDKPRPGELLTLIM